MGCILLLAIVLQQNLNRRVQIECVCFEKIFRVSCHLGSVVSIMVVLYWGDFATPLLPADIGSVSMTGAFGCHARGRRCCWHLVGQGQDCCSTSYNAQDSPHNNIFTPDVKSTAVEKAAPLGYLFFHPPYTSSGSQLSDCTWKWIRPAVFCHWQWAFLFMTSLSEVNVKQQHIII